MSKYVDLAEQVIEQHTYVCGTFQAGVRDALAWLDRNPDQVPGLTITESDYSDISDWARNHLHRGYEGREVLARYGITVVPDPEPTSAERLAGRTITESELIAAVDETNHEDMNEYQKARALLVHLGYTIPEPTNAAKLDKDIQEVDLHLTSKQLAEALIERGWTKAPGASES